MRRPQALHDLEEGERIGLRGPYGNCFPIEEMKGKDILFVAGGIGLVPLRSLMLGGHPHLPLPPPAVSWHHSITQALQ